MNRTAPEEYQHMAVISLGSNLGDSRRILNDAMSRLEAFSVKALGRSCIWTTEPVHCPPGSPDFLNAIVLLWPYPEETPQTLLGKLQQLEREFGRRPKQIMNEPRPLDLDLILFGFQELSDPELWLPHPRAHLRRFVLGPLAELAPDLIWPGTSRSVQQLLGAIGV